MTPMAKTELLHAGLSDTGHARRENEDRIHVDIGRGLFIVADGLGGHAAGERAAEAAVELIVARLARKTGTAEERMREAIAVANNEILRLASENKEWEGMACVVTAALIEDGQVTAGHVGDSRMYVLESGAIRKVTRDHSPVGELEDSGKLSEAAAMAHPRRNEVFRDIGSEPHGPDDEEFIDVLHFPFSPSSALLICSDGLSDQVTSEQIRRTVEAYPRDPKRAVQALVQAANDAGGKDNVSVVLVEGSDYNVPRAATPLPVPPLARPHRSRLLLPFLIGFLLAVGLLALVRPYLVEGTAGLHLAYGTVRPPLTWKVGGGGQRTITDALNLAKQGDTILVEPGTYRENIRLTSGVTLISAQRHAAVLEGGEVLVLADGISQAHIVGFKLAGPAEVGIRILNSGVDVTDVEITGMRDAGIEVEGEPLAYLRANQILSNPGVGIAVSGAARPIINNNVITGNGKTPGALRPGIHVAGAAMPVIASNFVADNGSEQIWVSPLFNAESLLSKNFISPGVKDRKNLIKVITR
jgi:parallel beta-helix repeat protein